MFMLNVLVRVVSPWKSL